MDIGTVVRRFTAEPLVSPVPAVQPAVPTEADVPAAETPAEVVADQPCIEISASRRE